MTGAKGIREKVTLPLKNFADHLKNKRVAQRCKALYVLWSDTDGYGRAQRIGGDTVGRES